MQRLFYRKTLPSDFAPKRILVVKLDHLGDVILATPVFSNLRRAYPDAELHALTGEWATVALERHPDVERVITYNSPAFCRTGRPTSLKETFTLYRRLRREKYDLMVGLRIDWRLVGLACGRLTPKRLDRAALQIANKLGVQRFSGVHETTRNLDVLKQAGIPTPIKTAIFAVPAADEKEAAERLATYQVGQQRPLVAIHPGSPIARKQWMRGRYAALADWLIHEKHAHILFVGVEAEIPIVTDIQTAMCGEAVSIAGETTLTQLASILHQCDVFIGNDSGPMHLAAAVGTPTVGLYGPGDPTRFGPAGEKCQTIRGRSHCPCSGIACRFGESGCMSEIQVADVIQVLEASGYLAGN